MNESVSLYKESFFDNLLDRNVEVRSTGETSPRISGGPIDVGSHQGDVRLTLDLGSNPFLPTYRDDGNLHPIISVETNSRGRFARAAPHAST